MLYGIDASHYQELIDWKRVKASGIRFAILKASEGVGYEDPMFEQNVRGALENGILPGSYHFFLPRLDPVQQAKHYSSVLKDSLGKRACLPPCIDLETSGPGREGLNQSVRLFLQEVEAQTGRRAMIYTSPVFGRPTCRNRCFLKTGSSAATSNGLCRILCGWRITPLAGLCRCIRGQVGRSGSIPVQAGLEVLPHEWI